MRISKRSSIVYFLPIVMILVASCAAGSRDLAAQLVAANLLAASMAQGYAVAIVADEKLRPDRETAIAIQRSLSAIEVALDGAGAALRAGLPEVAASSIKAAELQIEALQPVLPQSRGETQ